MEKARERNDYETMKKLQAKQNTVKTSLADAYELRSKCKSIMKLKLGK